MPAYAHTVLVVFLPHTAAAAAACCAEQQGGRKGGNRIDCRQFNCVHHATCIVQAAFAPSLRLSHASGRVLQTHPAMERRPVATLGAQPYATQFKQMPFTWLQRQPLLTARRRGGADTRAAPRRPGTQNRIRQTEKQAGTDQPPFFLEYLSGLVSTRWCPATWRTRRSRRPRSLPPGSWCRRTAWTQP